MSDQKVPPAESLITNEAQKSIGLLHQLRYSMDTLHTRIHTGDDDITDEETRLVSRIISDMWKLIDHDLIKGQR